MRKLWLIFLATCTFSSLYSQEWKIGVINDPDGYTNIRAGKTTKSEVIGKLLANELFRFADSTAEQWLMIKMTKCNCETSQHESRQITGFVHKSRIRDVNNLGNHEMTNLLDGIFRTELDLYNQMLKVVDRTSEEFKRLNRKWTVFHEEQFDLSLGQFTNYVCVSQDASLTNKFLNIMEVEDGSADEVPTFALGRLFICRSEWTFEQIRQHLTLMDQLEWGLVNVVFNMTDDEADVYKTMYNELRKSAGMAEVDLSKYE
tara:strand:- start:8356 stop:9132 length:777 start_codon:yes stop_codon:yes gene_type:complete